MIILWRNALMMVSFNTFTAIVNLSRFNNSCLKSPALTLVDLIFQSRSFSLNQLACHYRRENGTAACTETGTAACTATGTAACTENGTAPCTASGTAACTATGTAACTATGTAACTE